MCQREHIQYRGGANEQLIYKLILAHIRPSWMKEEEKKNSRCSPEKSRKKPDAFPVVKFIRVFKIIDDTSGNDGSDKRPEPHGNKSYKTLGGISYGGRHLLVYVDLAGQKSEGVTHAV